jgi:flavin reductase (DIM6/NTAB) family NADH-FMN oxidoreductase RutF
MKQIPVSQFHARPFMSFDRDWALLVSGSEKGQFAPNPMTISWGSYGTLWNRPVVTVYVRRTRHSFECLQDVREFTVNFMPSGKRYSFDYCGAHSGREGEKWSRANISHHASKFVSVPRVTDALTVFECKVLGVSDFEQPNIYEPSVMALYPKVDFHRVYFGEVLGIFEAE